MKENTSFLSIKNWHKNDKPREKLLDKGKDTLSDAELVAVLIRSGSRNETAVELARKILMSVQNNLNNLGKLSVPQLMKFKGIGEAKAIAIVASLELGRRKKLEKQSEKIKITSSKSVFNMLQPIIGELPHEEFWILYLNNAHKVIQASQISKGGITGTLVDVRLVLKKALELGATALILAHNHPSGVLKPSMPDKQVTLKLKMASESLDIKILDHLIITEKAYFNFADQQLL